MDWLHYENQLGGLATLFYSLDDNKTMNVDLESTTFHK